MISPQVKSVIKYVLSLSVAGFLFWYIYRDFDFSSSFVMLRQAEFGWILLSIFCAIISHLIRAYRWNLLLGAEGYNPSVFRTFWAVMVGYLANLAVPRMGEVSRCGILKKTDNVPMTTSIGTVVAERIIDVLSLLTCIFFGFVIEFERLNEFLTGFLSSQVDQIGKNIFDLYLLAGFLFVLILAVFLIIRTFKRRIVKAPFFLKIRTFLREMVSGLTSIRRVKNGGAFWLCTVAIWVLYFLMSYVMIFALEATSFLGVGAGITLLIMGGLGMSAPVQGGIGTFHALVTAALILYGVEETDGQLFAFLLHTSQVLMVVVVGGISLIISMIIKSKNSDIQMNDAHEG